MQTGDKCNAMHLNNGLYRYRNNLTDQNYMGPETPVHVVGEASHVVGVQIVRPSAKSYSRKESDTFPN